MDVKNEYYEKKKDTYCDANSYGNGIEQVYDNISEAQSECKNNSTCTMVYDMDCNGSYKLCDGTARDSSEGSCVWIKKGK